MSEEKYGLWDVIKDFFKGKLSWVDSETLEDRHEKCYTCDARDNHTCGICGCYLPAKIRLQKSSCPMEKW